jgi:S-adenosylmethionine synthetase
MTTTAAPCAIAHVAEDVFPGHPDRIADAVAERIVDEALALHPDALVGVEVAVHRTAVFVTGCVAGCVPPALALDELVREEVAAAGYTGRWAFEPAVAHDLDQRRFAPGEQEIRRFSDDQNVVVGHAEGSGATGWLPPAPFAARRLREALVALRHEHADLLGPDGKVLVRLDERDGRYRWARVNVSLHHAPRAGDYETLYRLVWPVLERVSAELDPALPGLAGGLDDDVLHLNGAGDFSCGGTFGDNGLSGKKLVVDAYGPSVPIGGGALCGKDPHKVDRLGALLARQLALRLVRDGGAGAARVVLGWLPGAEASDTLHALVDGEQWPEQRIRAAIPVPDLSIEASFQRLELAGVRWVEVMRRGYFGNDWAWEA